MTEWIPDNPDGSGEAWLTIDGIEVPYQYEHLTDNSTWEVVSIVPLKPTAYLNTYQVSGEDLAVLLFELDDPECAEQLVSVQRIEEHRLTANLDKPGRARAGQAGAVAKEMGNGGGLQ